MPDEIALPSAEDAIQLFFSVKPGMWETTEISLKLGPWAGTDFILPEGYHSEIPSPFLDAYHELQKEIYRVAALILYGNADIRSLSTADIDKFQLKVRVQEGSSELSDNLPLILDSLFEHAFANMTGPEAMITILGLALIVATAWGFLAFLERKKQTRIEEIQSEERRHALEQSRYSSDAHLKTIEAVIEKMSVTSDVAARAATAGETVNEHFLAAAAQVPETVAANTHISRSEAREIRSSTRRRSIRRLITQQLRVVDINTADEHHTTIVLEDPENDRQYKVTFRDELIAEAKRPLVYDLLRTRGLGWFKTAVKEIDGEVISVQIIDIDIDPPAGLDPADDISA